MAALNTIWSFNHTADEKPRIKAYWDKKMRRIERLLSNYHADLVEFRITAYHHEPQKTWEFRAVLHLPTGTIAAQETRPTLEEALDLLADELVRQIKRHKQHVRKDYIYRRRRRAQRDLSVAGPLLQTDVERQRQDAFFELMKPLMKRVRDYAQREIAILESNRLIPQNEVNAQELLDEVLTRAWREYEDRPGRLDLETWTLQLMQQRLEQLAQSHPEISTQVKVPGTADEPLTPDGDLDEVDFWLERIFVDLGDRTLEEIVPDPDARPAEQVWEDRETRQQVQQALAQLSAADRSALLWHEVDGFEIDEIAMIQNRSEDEIRQSIQRAKADLASRLAGLVAGKQGG